MGEIDALLRHQTCHALGMLTPIGATITTKGARFRVWAPKAKTVELFLPGPSELTLPMKQHPEHYWELHLPDAKPGLRYYYKLDGVHQYPDPASRFQPEGVHGASALVDPEYNWTDQGWCGLTLQHHVFYELHVGTFTQEGTFDAVIPHLPKLKDLGITAIELMPIAQFPGKRNWGYDGVYLFAPQCSYGGPAGLKNLVNAAHAHGLAIILDVVYNHLGPEGNYLNNFGHYFTDCHKTPWGDAMNLDGPDSGPVREFFLQNVEYWIREYHIDGLRLDAVHEIHDESPVHLLAEIQQRATDLASSLNRHVNIIAECDANNSRYLAAQELGGYGLQGQWLDDFHHALYTRLEGSDSSRYKADYPDLDCLQKAYQEGFVYSGQYCPTRRRVHGTSSSDISPGRFVVFTQNHDQVGNKLLGTRLTSEVSYESVKLGAAATLLSPYLPLIFMGEELRETRPFMFFVDHGDPDLIRAVQEGRREAFMEEDDTGEFQDPADIETFNVCIIDHSRTEDPVNGVIWQLYKDLLTARRTQPAIAPISRLELKAQVFNAEKCLAVYRNTRFGATMLLLNFSLQKQTLPIMLTDKSCGVEDAVQTREFALTLDTASDQYRGPGTTAPGTIRAGIETPVTVQPESAVLYCVTY